MPYNMNNVDGVVKGGGKKGSSTGGHSRHKYNGYEEDDNYRYKYNYREESPQACGSGEAGGLAGRYQYQYQFFPPAYSPPSSGQFLGDTFDQQEKVSVRLVANQGLVVEPEEEDVVGGQCKNGCNQSGQQSNFATENYDTTLASSSASYFCATGVNPKLTASSTRISNGVGSCAECSNPAKNADHDSELYPQRIRRSSENGSGPPGQVSSLTPLVDVKHNHKIQVVVTSQSMKNSGGNGIHDCYGVVFGFSASLFFSLTLLLAKVLKNRDHHPISIAFWRYLGILLPSIPIALFYVVRGRKEKVLREVWPIHDMDKAANALALLMRGVLGSTSVILRFCSLNYLTIADSSVISYCAPVFAAIFAPFCLKDKGGFIPVLLGGVAIGGIFFVCKPPFLMGSDAGFDSETLKGVFLASLSMLCAAGVLIIMRNLEQVHFSMMLFILGIWGVFEAGVLAVSLDVLKVPELLPDIVMMAGVAILTFFGQLFVLLAMKMGQIGSVSVMRSCDIFLSFLWQYLFLKTEPEPLGILSAILIILAVWFISLRKWIASLRTSNQIRKRLSFILY